MPEPVEVVTLTTNSADYPTVTGALFLNPVRFGVPEVGGPFRVVRYKIEGANAGIRAALFCDALRGRTVVVGQGGFSPQSFILPHRFPGNEKLVCRAAEGELIGAQRPGFQLVESNLAEIIATYGIPDYPLSIEDDPQGIASLAGGPYAFMTVRTSTSWDQRHVEIKADDDTLTFPSMSLQIPIVTYNCKFHNLPFLGEELTEQMLGKINLFEIFGKAPGTVRFDGPDSEFSRGTEGDRNYDVDFSLVWKPIGWNYEIPDQGGSAVRVYLQDGSDPYKSVDFSALRMTALGGP